MLGSFATGAQVVQLGGGSGTRELYYYGRALRQLTVVGEDVNLGLLQEAGVQSNTPVVGRRVPCHALGSIPDASVDAVVSLAAISAEDATRQAQIVAVSVC
jgi:hypothetical protein